MTCPYADIRGEHVICSRIAEMIGLPWGLPKEACAKCTYPKNGDDSFIRATAKEKLGFFLFTGNSRTNFATALDIPALAARFKAMSTEEERRAVVRKAVEFQCVLEKHGGHQPRKVLLHLRELEDTLGVKGELAKCKIRDEKDVETRQWHHDEEHPDRRGCQNCK